MRLIDADALREVWLEWDIYDEIEANTVLYSIDDQPTINPEDLRPKGRWEAPAEHRFSFKGKHLGTICSCCCSWSDNQYDFCPNCGARMEE